MESASYWIPARVGFETVRSSTSLPAARTSSNASVRRLGVSFQPVRLENLPSLVPAMPKGSQIELGPAFTACILVVEKVHIAIYVAVDLRLLRLIYIFLVKLTAPNSFSTR